ncbi:MAG: glutaredoxin family protein [Synechococcaceae cyanobacterium]|nr:glutaredoxin family protein [Synechococcaceae cyanobacterium]
MAALLLYTRAGCCLCEGLEERLRQLEPSPAFTAVDVDGDPELRARWGMEVPVLALVAVPDLADGVRPLPRVPPRLAGERLRQWLERHGAL